MDRKFMEQYFDKTFDDVVGEIVGNDKKFAELKNQAQHSIDVLMDSVGGEHAPAWSCCEEVIGQLYLMQIHIAKLAYLRGAEDRERMLR